MSPRYAVLAGRIRQELDLISKTVERVEKSALALQKHPEERAFIDSLALNLQSFYSGVERVFQHIAADLDDSVPKGDAWHRELLKQMAVEVRSVRPAVITREDAETLDEYLRFRHVVRNAYAIELDRERVQYLARRLPGVFQRVKERLAAFADFLDELAQPRS